KMRIEQYFLMTNYSLWEVILNGDSPTPTRVIDGVLQLVAPTTAEQSLKIYKAEVKISSSASTTTQNIAFMSSSNTDSTNEPVSAVASVSTVGAKIPVSALPNVDSLSNVVIYSFFSIQSNSPQLDNDDLKQIDTDDLEEMDLIWKMAMLIEAMTGVFKQKRSHPTMLSWHSHLQVLLLTMSTNKPISAAASVCALSAKIHVSALPNVDILSNAIIYSFFDSQTSSPQLDNDDLKKIDADDLEEIDLKWQMAMLTVRARRFLQRTGRNLGANGPTSMGFDMSKVECYNCHWKGHFAMECSYDWSFQADEEPTNYALMTFTSSSSSSDNELRDNALVVLRQNLEKAEQERDDLKLKLEKFQTSSKNLSDLLASQTNAKTELGYSTQVFTRFMFDCEDYCTFKSDESLPPSPIYDRYQSRDGYHVVPPPYRGTFMPPKPDLVFHNAPNDVETVHTAFNAELSPTKHDNDLSHTHRPSAPIIEEVFDSKDEYETKIPQNVHSFIHPTEQVKSFRPSVKHVETSILTTNPTTAIPKPTSNGNCRNRKACFVCQSLDHLIKDLLTMSKLVPITVARPVTTVVPKPKVTRPRQAKTVVTKPNSQPIRHINRSPSPKASNFPPKVTAVKVPQGNPQHALKDKGVIDSGCSRHMIGNMFYLSDFKELNGGYVAFGGNPKGGKISGKGKFDGKVDEGFLVGYSVSSKAFRVFNSRTRIVQETLHINFLEDKPNVAGSGPTWLFDIDTLTKTMNYQPVTAGNQSNPSTGVQEQFDAETAGEDNVQQYVLFLVWSSGFTNPQNTNGDVAFDEKEPKFEGRKPESEVNVSLSSKFEDFSNNSINEDNAAGTLVPAVGQLFTNSTNTFSAAGPLNASVSPTHRKSSCIDSSQYPDDPNMPELEGITYSNNEEDVGAEADFTNLETSITVSPIPTTRVHKDHPVTQIISNLSSATQKRSMIRVAKDQGGLSQINNNDFHTCMFACFLSQEEPKRVHQAFKDPSWIKAMQEELL
nr:hypothetical protein [Tanacetum cinerariifolium]